jgi:hypothetical protein
MTGWDAALWGILGAFAVEGMEFVRAIRRVGGWPWRWPGEPGPAPFVVSVMIRMGVGAILAAAAGTTNQVSGPFGALAIGVGAPLLIEQLSGVSPTPDPPTRRSQASSVTGQAPPALVGPDGPEGQLSHSPTEGSSAS